MGDSVPLFLRAIKFLFFFRPNGLFLKNSNWNLEQKFSSEIYRKLLLNFQLPACNTTGSSGIFRASVIPISNENSVMADKECFRQ